MNSGRVIKVSLSQVKRLDERDDYYSRVKEWQKKNNTRRWPSSNDIGLVKVAVSINRDGNVSGTIFIDLKGKYAIGVPEGGSYTFID